MDINSNPVVTNRTDVDGFLARSSHLFYMSKDSKVFFLEIFDKITNLPVIIVTSLSSSLTSSTRSACKKILTTLCIGRRVSISHLKTVILHDKTVLRVTRNSNIDLFEEDVDVEEVDKENVLVTYRGIVTKTKDASSGHYILDKHVHLVTSLMCVVSNVAMLEPGQTVTVMRAHIVKFQNSKWLLMCGNSFLVIDREGESAAPLHYSPDISNRYLANPVINLVQRADISWSSLDVLTLWNNYLLMSKNFQSFNINIEKLLTISVTQESVKIDQDSGSRSLSKEFLNHTLCSLGKKVNSKLININLMASLTMVKEIMDFKNIDNADQDKVIEKELDFENAIDPIIVGVVDIDENGRVIIKDNYVSIICVANWGPVRCGALVELKRFTIGVERSKLSYLILYEFTILENIATIPPIIEDNISLYEDSKTLDILLRSSIKINKFGISFMAYGIVQGKEKCVLRIDEHSYFLLFCPNLSIKLESRQGGCFEKLDPNTLTELNCLSLFGNVPCYVLRKGINISLVGRGNYPEKQQAYSLASEADIPGQELISLNVWIVDMVLDGDVDIGKLLQSDRVKLQLMITDYTEPGVPTYICYFQHCHYPVGLVPGTQCFLSSVLKTLSKKGQVYFQSTPFTVVQPIPLDCVTKLQADGQLTCTPSLSLPPNCQGIVELLCSVEKVLSLQIAAECKGCSSPASKGQCSYVGCNISPPSFLLSAKTTCLVLANNTFVTLICTSLEGIRTLLNCSVLTWEQLKLATTNSSTGVLQLSTKNTNEWVSEVVNNCLIYTGYVISKARRFSSTRFFSLRLNRPTTMELINLYDKCL